MRILTGLIVTLFVGTAHCAEGPSDPPQATPIAADARPVKKKYVPPPGFAGHDWGAARASFERLPAAPLKFSAAGMRGKQREPFFYCTASGVFGAGCDLNALIEQMNTRREGGGFHVLSEYKIEGQGFKFSDDGVLLYPAIYQFCAQWDSTERVMPENFAALNQFCGMRLLFETESLAELRNLPEDHVTKYDRLLDDLIDEFGKPAGFLKRGRVTIETGSDDEPAGRADRKFSTWRWCPARDRELQTSCKASVVLSIDPELGRGVVLISAPALWQFAYARHELEHGDPLFAVMHARPARQ
jgi:hypothetical protein